MRIRPQNSLHVRIKKMEIYIEKKMVKKTCIEDKGKM